MIETNLGNHCEAKDSPDKPFKRIAPGLKQSWTQPTSADSLRIAVLWRADVAEIVRRYQDRKAREQERTKLKKGMEEERVQESPIAVPTSMVRDTSQPDALGCLYRGTFPQALLTGAC